MTTFEVLLARVSPISGKELNHRVQLIRNALQNTKTDPHREARQIYDAIIGPIAEDLTQVGANTPMLYLDGGLRYLPFAALYNGNRWMAEKYNMALFNELARTTIKDQPSPTWRMTGLGVSRKVKGFTPLPGVEKELENIVCKDETDTDGILSRELHLNDDFTLKTLKHISYKRYPVVHIASHFVIKPGSVKDSFLLLRDGNRLTLAQFENNDYDLGAVDLSSLSACNTSTPGIGADGTGIEGVGTVAMKTGAKGVLSTLWPIADESTGLLMRNFYVLRQEQSHIIKAEALRRAQMTFIHGDESSSNHKMNPSRGRFQIGIGNKDDKSAYETEPDASPYAHPYYWAPFILMGNWL